MADEPRVDEPGGTAPARKRREPGSLTWLWMVLALATMAGFLTWLGITSEPTSVAIVETDDDDDGLIAEEVSKDSLGDHKAAFAGIRVRVADVGATGNLGPRIFWGELGTRTNQVPILVRMDSAAAAGFTVEMDVGYTITGIVHPMTDSIAGEWDEAGEFTGEGERMQAGFADYYIQAERIRRTPASAGGAGGGAGQDSPAAADTASG